MTEIIRRAAAWARRQLFTPSGRHRLDRSTEQPAVAPEPPRTPPAPLATDRPHWEEVRPAKDPILVRPFMLTAAERARLWAGPRRRVLLVCPQFPGVVAH
ncbi:hypothetical protein [Streptomyces sp. UNOC14_S4]|uniref:hypothetical protein n=1 Tax=Streptomyces sp. UNOC14_S4 TaxID=2872340 RepID=UPI001E5BF469|nr:hypothetical protein [Streptomyces sp. UNOC14_S4]MCC3769393.1 hypothetical protein [Streptomyces sp. UNOC14_S4]